MKRLIAVVLLALPSLAATPAYINAGPLLCGASLRTGVQVQTWCWTSMPFGAETLGYNAIMVFPPEGGSVIATYNYRVNSVAWKFTLAGPTVLWEATANGGVIQTGRFPILPPVAIVPDTLPDATCNQPWSARLAVVGGTPPYTWSAVDLPAWVTMQDGLNTENSEILLSGTPLCEEGSTASVKLPKLSIQ